MSLSKSNKLINILNYRLRVILADKRVLTGHMLAFDTHMNLVLSDCEEFRRSKNKGSKEEVELKRTLGLVILRGEHLVSISVDGPPPPNVETAKARMAQLNSGAGVGRSAGRGLPIAPPGGVPPAGLTAPVRGMGAPAPGMMAPRGPAASAAPIPYARPPVPGGMPPRPGMPMPPPMGFRPGMPPPPGFRPGMPMPPGMRPPPPGGMPPPPFPPGGPMGRGMPPPGYNGPQGFRPPPGPRG